LWRSPDGTGLHAPPGTLVRDENGAACCHFCGEWFQALGSHVRVHGYSAAAYREATGLTKTRPLAAPSVSSAISKRQLAAYRQSADMQARFAAGQDMARDGTLAARAVTANTRRRPESATIARNALEKGRETNRAHLEATRQTRLADLGASSLDEYLRSAYGAGASLDDLARTLRSGREQLRQAMVAAGIQIRPSGRNTIDGKRARARYADAVAATKVGTQDLTGWLVERRAKGWTLAQLASAVDHSPPWVRWRLESRKADTQTG
jgi:hypothetical protein